MFVNSITKISYARPFSPSLILAHTGSCPTRHRESGPGAPMKRAERPGKVRMGFIPDEWFQFFHSKTGVSGPYVFGLVVTNYLFSKEIYVMEHEYYGALSIGPMMYFVATRLGPGLAQWLDKEVDDHTNALEKSRKDELAMWQNIIADAKRAQQSAEGQKLLMDAKKENIAMQLEAAYRERCMRLFLAVTGRMEYQVKLFRASARIHQKWMLQWILSNVMKALTPEFEKSYLDKAIADVAALASRAKR